MRQGGGTPLQEIYNRKIPGRPLSPPVPPHPPQGVSDSSKVHETVHLYTYSHQRWVMT